MRAVREQAEPLTLLASVQGVWEEALGGGVAGQAQPIAEREGVVTVTCRSASWAQELDLMQTELLARLNGALGEATEAPLRGLRFSADAARHDG